MDHNEAAAKSSFGRWAVKADTSSGSHAIERPTF